MKTLLTLTIQIEIESKTLESYEKKRDKFIRKLENVGLNVDVTSEDFEDDEKDEKEN